MSIVDLRQVLPRAPAAWLEQLVSQMPNAGIDSVEEKASFIAQLAHESDEFTHLEENLFYTAARLTQVWPKRFPSIDVAKPFERNPEKLANLVYANRLGNRGEDSGDGWRYRGRGPIQLTGAANYLACGQAIGVPLFTHPELLLTPRAGISSACWYWKVKKLDELDDDEEVSRETKLVNGGIHGLARRQAYFDKAYKVLGGKHEKVVGVGNALV